MGPPLEGTTCSHPTGLIVHQLVYAGYRGAGDVGDVNNKFQRAAPKDTHTVRARHVVRRDLVNEAPEVARRVVTLPGPHMLARGGLGGSLHRLRGQS